MNIGLALMLSGVITLTVAFVVAGIFRAIFGDGWVDKTSHSKAGRKSCDGSVELSDDERRRNMNVKDVIEKIDNIDKLIDKLEHSGLDYAPVIMVGD